MKRFSLIITIVGLSWCELRAMDKLVVTLPSTAEFQASSIRLSELAAISGADNQLRQRAGNLEMADRTKDLGSVKVTQREIEYRLLLAGFSADQFEIRGAPLVVISVNRRKVQPEEVVNMARKELIRRLGVREVDVSITLVQPVIATLPEVAMDDLVEFVCEPQGSQVRMGRAQINVTIKVRGENRHSVPVYFDSQPFADVLVAYGDVPKGEMLDAKNTRIERRPTAGQVTAPEKVVGRAAIKPISSGQVIQVGDVDMSEPLVVKSQEQVLLVSRAGDIEVSAYGIAQQDGKVGQLIRVQNSYYKTVVVGRVTAPGVVTVTPGGSR